MRQTLVIQCARTAIFNDPVERSIRSSCANCRQQVWLSATARELAKAVMVAPICDVCKPAAPVTLTEDTWEQP